MPGLSIRITTNGQEVVDRLDRAAAAVSRPVAAAKAAAEWIAGETFRIFSSGYTVDGPWAPLSDFTKFVRLHRANSPRTGEQMVGRDTGLLMGSFMPSWSDDGKQFGAGTNVEYAPDFNDGGPSKGGTVAIAGFKRKNMRRKGKDYVMTIKPGHDVPARQFFPKGLDGLQAWGYTDKVREIFALYAKPGSEGQAA